MELKEIRQMEEEILLMMGWKCERDEVGDVWYWVSPDGRTFMDAPRVSRKIEDAELMLNHCLDKGWEVSFGYTAEGKGFGAVYRMPTEKEKLRHLGLTGYPPEVGFYYEERDIPASFMLAKVMLAMLKKEKEDGRESTEEGELAPVRETGDAANSEGAAGGGGGV